jgi:hypothetical protein
MRDTRGSRGWTSGLGILLGDGRQPFNALQQTDVAAFPSTRIRVISAAKRTAAVRDDQ